MYTRCCRRSFELSIITKATTPMTIHSFHIPVLGLGYSVDTPLKVAPLGISSVISIVDDEMIEKMRKYHTENTGDIYVPIQKNVVDFRSKRITSYLNLIQKKVDILFQQMRELPFEEGNLLTRYFELLPKRSPLKVRYEIMKKLGESAEKAILQKALKNDLRQGAIDVNIMSKVDKLNVDENGDLQTEMYSDASAALRGFANSNLRSSLILSAGMNPRLYNYLEQFPDFYPDANDQLRKKVILKVSDFRSAFIQAKYLAKKGIWVSEFRVESGLNCGGHAFATDGYLLGPILEEFKLKRTEMIAELFGLYTAGLESRGHHILAAPPLHITVQGGIGTAEEDDFLLNYYQVDATGWGSPFLLVPEVTNVDKETLKALGNSTAEDYYVSNSSPLGVLFNNFKNSSAERQRLMRIEKGRPGSPCTKKYLVSNTEFTKEPICTASREYQNLKIKQLNEMTPRPEQYDHMLADITEKLCLCDGLSTSALIKCDQLKPKENRAVSICPGPNLQWFSGEYTLDEMVNHIYGKGDLLSGKNRPNMFINELNLYIEYYRKEVEALKYQYNEKRSKYLEKFHAQLLQGIAYYQKLFAETNYYNSYYRAQLLSQLSKSESLLKEVDLQLA